MERLQLSWLEILLLFAYIKNSSNKTRSFKRKPEDVEQKARKGFIKCAPGLTTRAPSKAASSPARDFAALPFRTRTSPQTSKLSIAATISNQNSCHTSATRTPHSLTSILCLRCSLAAPSSSGIPRAFLSPPVTPKMGTCFGRCVSKESHAATTTSCLWSRPSEELETDLISTDESDKREKFIFRIWKFRSKQTCPQFLDKFWEHQNMNYAKLNTKSTAEGISDIQLQNLDVHNLLNLSAHAQGSNINCTPTKYTAMVNSRTSSSLELEWEHEYAHLRHYTNATSKPLNTSPHTYQQSIQLNDDSWQYLTNDEDQLNSLASISSLPATDKLPHTTTKPHGSTRCLVRSSPAAAQHKPHANYQRCNTNGSFTRTSSHNSWSHISTPESLEWDIDEEQQQQRQLRVEDDNLGYETLELLHQIEQLKNQVLEETGEGLFEQRGGGGMAFTANYGSAEAVDIS